MDNKTDRWTEELYPDSQHWSAEIREGGRVRQKERKSGLVYLIRLRAQRWHMGNVFAHNHTVLVDSSVSCSEDLTTLAHLKRQTEEEKKKRTQRNEWQRTASCWSHWFSCLTPSCKASVRLSKVHAQHEYHRVISKWYCLWIHFSREHFQNVFEAKNCS